MENFIILSEINIRTLQFHHLLNYHTLNYTITDLVPI